MEYRVYILGPDCRVFARHEFDAGSDAVALEFALTFFESTLLPQHYGFELWQAKRRIHDENC